MAEPSTVNRVVVSSSLTRGASVFRAAFTTALFLERRFWWAIGSAGEHRLHTAGVTGSNPVSPTRNVNQGLFLGSSMAEPSTVNRVVVSSSLTRGASILWGRHAAALSLKGCYCWAVSSGGEHYLDTVGVTGSIPVSPTNSIQKVAGRRPFLLSEVCLQALGVDCQPSADKLIPYDSQRY